MTLIDGDKIITAQLYDEEHEEFTEKKMSIIEYVNAYTDEGVTVTDEKMSLGYCEKEGISTSKLNEAQRTLYYIAENMKMDKSISEEGYEHFQMAIRALKEESVLDKIKTELMKLQTYKMFEGEETVYVERNEVSAIIDRYKREIEE